MGDKSESLRSCLNKLWVKLKKFFLESGKQLAYGAIVGLAIWFSTQFGLGKIKDQIVKRESPFHMTQKEVKADRASSLIGDDKLLISFAGINGTYKGVDLISINEYGQAYDSVAYSPENVSTELKNWEINEHSLGVNQASPTKLGHSYLYVKGSDGNNQLFLIVTGRAFNNQSSTNDFGSYVYKPADLLNGLETEATVPTKNFDIPNDIHQLNTTYYQRERVDIHQLKDELKSVTSYIDDNGLDYE
ncbi:hypothetical protein [Weissella confusa]|uniref:hypothetical protein n=1 Tax=Weissella confusa TaxID=1583 RepID=UPI003EE05E6B